MKHRISVFPAMFVIWLFLYPLWGKESGVPGRGNFPPRQLPGFMGGSRTHMGVFPSAPEKWAKSWVFGNFVHYGGEVFSGELPHYPPWSLNDHDPCAYRVVPRNYSSAHFVQQWRGRDPIGSQRDQGIVGSVLLFKGMDKVAVMGKLGSPIQRLMLERRELWRYSSYSLLFESGVLAEIR